MLILLKIGFFEIDFSSIISFLVGILLGCLIMGMLYALLVVMSLGDKKFLVKTQDDGLEEQEVKDMILKAQEAFKDKSLRGKQGKLTHCKNIASDLVIKIASSFYPKSKYPLLELSVEESIMLVGYIQKRVDGLLDKKVLKLFKSFKVGQIVTITKQAGNIADNKFVKIGTKYGAPAIGYLKKAINVINPAWWFKKVVTDNVTNLILNKLCLVMISVVGEEAYKIYSKSLFNKEVTIESNVDMLLESLDKDIAKVKAEADLNQGKQEINPIEAPVEVEMPQRPVIRYKSKAIMGEKYINRYENQFDSNMKYKQKRIEEPVLLLDNTEDEISEEDINEEESE